MGVTSIPHYIKKGASKHYLQLLHGEEVQRPSEPLVPLGEPDDDIDPPLDIHSPGERDPEDVDLEMGEEEEELLHAISDVLLGEEAAEAELDNAEGIGNSDDEQMPVHCFPSQDTATVFIASQPVLAQSLRHLWASLF